MLLLGIFYSVKEKAEGGGTDWEGDGVVGVVVMEGFGEEGGVFRGGWEGGFGLSLGGEASAKDGWILLLLSGKGWWW